MGKLIDLSGRRFGMIIVAKRYGALPCRQPLWLCFCDCGRTTVIAGHHLRSGTATSCGCKRGQPTRISA